MKRTTYFLISLLFIVSCTKNDDESAACIPLSITPEFRSGSFKTNYTIMLPANYTGAGLTSTAMGNKYFKRNGMLVILKYAYCDSVSCADFGPALPSPEPASIDIMVDTTLTTCDKKIRFCENGNTVGIFYYVDIVNVAGRLFWYDGGEFKEALEVYYNASSHVEVMEILKTIQKRR